MTTTATEGPSTSPSQRAELVQRQRRYIALAWLVLALTVATTLCAALWAWQQRKQTAYAQFSSRTAMATASLSTYMKASERSLLAAASMMERQPDLDRPQFKAFIDKLGIDSDHAGIRGLAFARIIRDSDYDAYVARQREIYGPSFTIYPEGRREQYVVIDLMQPDTPTMQRLIGKDVADEPNRLRAMKQASETGSTTVTERISLTDRSRGIANEPGFLLYTPVYASALPTNATKEQRAQHLIGFTTAGFGWEQVLDEVIGADVTSQFDIELHQSADANQSSNFVSHALRDKYGQGYTPAFSATYPMQALGNNWRLSFNSPPTTAAVSGLPYIIVQTLIGISIGVLLFLQLLQLARRDQRSRALLDTAADRLPILIAYLDANRRYSFANRATADWFNADRTWRGQSLEEAHSNEPVLLDLITQAIKPEQLDKTQSWEIEVGNPSRTIQLHFVPDQRSNQSIVGWYLLANDTSEQMRTRRNLQKAHQQLQRITDRLPAHIVEYDSEQKVIFQNLASYQDPIWERPSQVGMRLSEVANEEEYRLRKPYIESALAGNDVDFILVQHRGQPEQRRLHVFYTPVKNESGEVTGFLALKTDITEHSRLQRELYDARERAEVTLSSISEAVFVTDINNHITYMNPAAESLSGWNLAEARNQPLAKIAPLRDPAISDPNDKGVSALADDLELTRRDGQRILVESSRSLLNDSEKRPIGHVMVLRDVTEARALTSRMAYLAHHDPLTELPNRLQLNEKLAQLVSSASRRGNGLAVLFIDLDLFKHVNDGLGHHVGDHLLQQVARRLQKCVGDIGSVYRTGGDEFVVLLHNVITRADVDLVAQRLLLIPATPYHVGTHELHQSFSIGISLFPDDGYDAATLMMRADAAMYLAKRNGRNISHFYTEELAVSIDARLELESSLRRSLRDGELQLYYQPRIDRRSGRISGAEALIRWPRGDRILSPGEFLSVAEETNLIIEIDQWALRMACRQNRAWQLAGLHPIRVSVNIAAANFDNDRLLSNIHQALEETGLAPEYLELELTETTLVRDTQRTERMLVAIKELGVHIAIDDFGTGFSNLSYLSNYGFDILKVDRSFTAGITSQENQGAITRAIIGLADQLGARSVAEGVETMEQAQWLANNDCDELQGYLFSKPLPATEFSQLLASHPHWQISNA